MLCDVKQLFCVASTVGDLAGIVRFFRGDQHSVVCDTLRPVHLSVDFEARTQPHTFSRSSAPFLLTKLVGVPRGVRTQSDGLGTQWGKAINYFEQTTVVGNSHVTGYTVSVEIVVLLSYFVVLPRSPSLFSLSVSDNSLSISLLSFH